MVGREFVYKGCGGGHESVSLEEHRAKIEALCIPLPVREESLVSQAERLCGLVLAEPVYAKLPVPPFTNSAMDGFAVRSEDIAGADCEGGVELEVLGDIPAGSCVGADACEGGKSGCEAGVGVESGCGAEVGGGRALNADTGLESCSIQELGLGQAFRIMTGAPLPAGADTVVRVEYTDHSAGLHKVPERVRVFRSRPRGADVRLSGEDVQVGDCVLEKGEVLHAAAIAGAISAGVSSVRVVPRPRVGIVSTGDELVQPGVAVRHGQIPDSNGALLASLVREAGAIVQRRFCSPDDPELLRRELAQWDDVDMIVTAGGISQGAFEVVRQAFEGGAMGAQMRFGHVRQQPGGPQGCGTVEIAGRRVPLVCLPGNPVSVFVSFYVHLAGAIAMLAGRAHTAAPRTFRARVAYGWKSPAGKTQLMPVALSSPETLDPTHEHQRNAPDQQHSASARKRCGGVLPHAVCVHRLGSGSHLAASLAKAQGIAIISPEVEAVAEGETVSVIPTGPVAFPVLAPAC